MKKTFRRLVSLVLALAMALSLAVSASATEMTFDSLVEYGNDATVVSSNVLIKMAYTTNVTNHGSLPTYTTETPVTITSAEKNFCGVIELAPASNRNQPAGFIGNIVPINGTYTITKAGLYLLLDEPLTGGPIKMAMVLEVKEGTPSPEESEDAVTGGIVTPGLHNFMRVNTYTPGQYADVPANHTFSENAKAAYEFDIMQGYGTTFGVGSNITRLASIIIACRLNCIYHEGENRIDDVYPGTTQERHLAYAKDHGILCDFDDVSKAATRAEFAAILASAFPDEALTPVNTVADNAIPDVTTDMQYADSIYQLYRAGILNGSDAMGTFYPASNINRGAACAIATRMCDEALRKSVTLDKEYAVLVDEAATKALDSYTLALSHLRDALLIATEALPSGNSSKLNQAYLHWVDSLKEFDNAISLCGNYPELREVKSVMTKLAASFKVADPAKVSYSSLSFWQSLAGAINKNSPLLDKCAALFTDLIMD